MLVRAGRRSGVLECARSLDPGTTRYQLDDFVWAWLGAQHMKDLISSDFSLE
jgi:hypothetical protein